MCIKNLPSIEHRNFQFGFSYISHTNPNLEIKFRQIPQYAEAHRIVAAWMCSMYSMQLVLPGFGKTAGATPKSASFAISFFSTAIFGPFFCAKFAAASV